MTCLETASIDQIIYAAVGSYSPESGYSEGSMSPNTNAFPKYDPWIEIIDQPQNSFRFRYLAESNKPHGPLRGSHAAKSGSKQSKTGPKIKLHNFYGEAIVRCWLTLPNSKEPSVHQLVGQGDNGKIKYEPHEIVVNSSNNHTASFDKLNIIHVVLNKEDYCRYYHNKKTQIQAESYEKPNVSHPFNFEATKKEMKNKERNLAALYFEVFVPQNGQYVKICETVSETIKNKKNPNTNDLKITRQSTVKGPCKGDQEVFIFVEKVVKGIKIKFFEEDPETMEEIWSDFARFGPLDVHHQVAIAFRTPPYHNENITEEVKVYFQLVRESNDSVSPKVTYYYQPSENAIYESSAPGRKRKCVHPEPLIPMSYNPMEIEQFNMPTQINDSNGIQILTLQGPGNDLSFSMSDLDMFGSQELDVDEIIRGLPVSTPVEDTLMIPDLLEIMPGLKVDGVKSPKPESGGLKSSPTIETKIKAEDNEDEEMKLNERLHEAILQKDLEEVKKVLQLATKAKQFYVLNGVNSLNKTPLQMAARVGEMKFVEMLLEAGGQINFIDCRSNDALHHVIVHSSNCLNILLKKCPRGLQNNCNTEGDNLLLLASRENCIDSVKVLLQNNWDIDFQNLKTGDTALHIVTRYRYENLSKFLINYGADVNIQNNSSYTPIHYAVSTETTSILEVLLTTKAKLRFSNRHCSTSEDDDDEDDEVLWGPNIYDLTTNEDIKKLLSSHENIQSNRDESSEQQVVERLDKDKNLTCQLADQMSVGFLKPLILNSNQPSQIIINYLKNNKKPNPIESLNKLLNEMVLK